MKITDKPDPDVGALFVANLVADAEATRIEGLSEEELLAEMERDGQERRAPMSGKDVFAKLQARTAAAAASQAAATPAAGPQPSAAPAGAVPTLTKPEARVVPLWRRPPRLVWWAAAASIAVVIGVTALSGPEIVSSIKPPTPHEKAEDMRDDAIGHCARAAWTPCKQLLDDAARIDPAGESEERVQKAREAIAKAAHPAPSAPDPSGR